MSLTARPLSPNIWVAPQIALEDLPSLAAQGIRRIVSHRPDGEEPGQPSATEMAVAAQAVGMGFTHAPVVGMPAEDAVAVTAGVLQDDAPVLMFCRSGTRSTFAWALAMRALNRSDAQTLRETAAAAGYDISRLPL
ncbi:TIGR01244 family sulfur transferase [Brevundimonas subvibrioides]|uniref:TIGR01244 family sulfur transferase n=1 Tax=Brevundimonas subvibrioides TaxID=74313 RepID=UPI0022B337EB|nr:TIGR01244 family sulfur transferase [Brevundimonas subvibrioides]